jgi:hypothetical protein
MSSLVRSLFGGSSATQNSQSTSTPVNFTAESLKGLAPDLAESLRGLVTSLGGGSATGVYDGKSGPTAPITGNESNILSQLMGQTGDGTDRAKYLSDVLTGKYLPGQENSNPFLSAAIEAAQRPTLQGLEETLSRTLPGRFTANGQMIQANTGDQGGSSAFDRAAGIATRGAAQAIGDIATNISSNAYEGERGRQNEAAGLSQAEVDTTIKNLQAQALPRLIQENGIERGMALFQQQTQSLLEILKTIGAVQAPTLANLSQSTGEAQSSSDKGIIPGLFPKGI